jgi:hypothetical protein
MKNKSSVYWGIALIIFQCNSYFYGTPILFENVEFNRINIHNFKYLMVDILAKDIFLIIGIVLLIYFIFKNRNSLLKS